jgi:hypothetical protein
MVAIPPDLSVTLFERGRVAGKARFIGGSNPNTAVEEAIKGTDSGRSLWGWGSDAPNVPALALIGDTVTAFGLVNGTVYAVDVGTVSADTFTAAF